MPGESAPQEGSGRPLTVFVSYSRDDQKRAIPVIRAIEDAGYGVWWDGLLTGGERYFQATEQALLSARAVVVLWSKVSVASHWVHDEATRARDARRLIPVSIDGTQPPLGFGQFQTIDLSRAKPNAGDPAFAKVLAAIASLHGIEFVAAPAPAGSRARGIDRRVLLGGAGALAAIAAGGAAWRAGWLGGGNQTRSIAVLPFANLSGNAGDAYFSDGVAAEIRAQLARNPMLQVAAQASSESFRDSREDAKTISRKLRVAHLLEGNIRKAGEKVRVAVDLTEGESGFSKWSHTFERPLTDVFAVQEEIATAVAAALSAELSRGADDDRNRGTTNFAAYDAYLRGNALYQLSSGEPSTRDALAKYEEATALDPNYAAAWSAQSRTLAYIASSYLSGEARAATFEKAIAAARRALQLDSRLADGHSALGYATLFGRRNVQAARAPFEKSAELGQGASDVLTRYAAYCAFVGDFAKGRQALARATRLDPLNALAQRSVGTLEFNARRYPESIAALRRALAINPELTGAQAAIALNQAMMGQFDEAARTAALEKGELRRHTAEAIIARRRGETAKAEAALQGIVAGSGDSALYEQAQVLAQWGEIDRAMATLLKAAETGDPGIVLIRTDPLVDPLRNRPEFSRLLRQVGFG